jgi:hypothetical protein
LPLETIGLDFKSGLEGLLKKKPTKAIFIGTRIGDPNAVNLLLHCSVILQVFIDLLCAVLTPMSAHNSSHLLLSPTPISDSVWNYRLVKNNSLLVRLAGLLL